MPTTIDIRRWERRDSTLSFVFIAIAMWALSIAVFGFDPTACAEIDAAAVFVSP